MANDRAATVCALSASSGNDGDISFDNTPRRYSSVGTRFITVSEFLTLLSRTPPKYFLPSIVVNRSCRRISFGRTSTASTLSLAQSMTKFFSAGILLIRLPVFASTSRHGAETLSVTLSTPLASPIRNSGDHADFFSACATPATVNKIITAIKNFFMGETPSGQKLYSGGHCSHRRARSRKSRGNFYRGSTRRTETPRRSSRLCA